MDARFDLNELLRQRGSEGYELHERHMNRQLPRMLQLMRWWWEERREGKMISGLISRCDDIKTKGYVVAYSPAGRGAIELANLEAYLEDGQYRIRT